MTFDKFPKPSTVIIFFQVDQFMDNYGPGVAGRNWNPSPVMPRIPTTRFHDTFYTWYRRRIDNSREPCDGGQYTH